VANSAGLLTLVGDPATFIVGDSINISFNDYLLRLSLGGVVALVTILVMLPLLFSKTWNKKLDNLNQLPHPKINHPRVLAVGVVIVAFVLLFFVVGESLPVPITPAAVALLAGLKRKLRANSGII
jgi:Na+/H+ antiporter NhaD/arsenite permease-like protein